MSSEARVRQPAWRGSGARREGLRLHRETGRLLCGLLAIASVSVLTLLLLHCPLFAVLRGGPADQHVTMHAGRPPLLPSSPQSAETYLRAWGYPSAVSPSSSV